MVWSDEAAVARRQGFPLVALESTLITHGLPWPVNRETAHEAEVAVRAVGAVPVTIALIEGEVRYGLSTEELDCLASLGSGLVKASRRDIAPSLVQRKTAGTTVSATLFLAHRMGMRVAATGGLGGVHREATHSFDISTDLDELSRADGMLLVCSGAKSILDIPATVEALETRGVIVVGYQTECFPAFTVRSSGLPLEWRVDTPQEAARIVINHHQLQLPGAILLVREVPAEYALNSQEMEIALEKALESASRAGLSGKEVTPFLLDAIRTATGDRSLRANRALIRSNAELAGQVAVALHQLGHEYLSHQASRQ